MDQMNNRTMILLKELMKNDTIKACELSKKMKCNERNVRSHIKLLRGFGYTILPVLGKNSGYKLIPEILSCEEWEKIKKLDENIYNKLEKILLEKI